MFANQQSRRKNDKKQKSHSRTQTKGQKKVPLSLT